jgi:hypothetical protein
MMVQNIQNLRVSGLCPSFGIVNKQHFRTSDLFPSSGNGRETSTLLGFMLLIYCAGVEPSSLLLRPLTGLLYLPWMMDDTNWWINDWQGKLKCSETTFPSAALPIANPRILDGGWNPSRGGGNPATKRLSDGTAVAPVRKSWRQSVTQWF